MTAFTILLGGDVFPSERLQSLTRNTRIIAADSGIKHAVHLSSEPELWVGDFDSSDEALVQQFSTVKRHEYPADKDKTDGEIAIDTALEMGADKLVMVGAFGGKRSDHAFAHLTQALELATRGIEIILTDGRQSGYPVSRKPQVHDLPNATSFSILAFDTLEGLTIKGAKWPLDDVRVPFGSSLVLSNETRGRLEVSLKDGRALLLVHEFD